MHRLALAALVFATGCACAPSYYDETAYAGSTYAASIESCAKGIGCTTLCARVFFRDQGTIDSCRVLSRDADGGAMLEMSYHELTCELSDEGWDWGDDGDYGDDGDDYDPCSDGSCDPPPDDDPPDDPYGDPPPDDPPPDDPPPDEDPPMEEGPL